MADFLTIASVPYKVTDFEETEPLELGHEEPAVDGTLRSTISGVKRRWRATLADLTQAEYATLFGSVGSGQHVTVAGDAMPASTTCRVKMSSGPAVRERLSFRRNVSVQILEA